MSKLNVKVCKQCGAWVVKAYFKYHVCPPPPKEEKDEA